MKIRIPLFSFGLFLLTVALPQHVYSQVSGDSDSMEKCSFCGKLKKRCSYKGNHPKCSVCGKLKENCRYKGEHPKCSTCKLALEQCKYGGNHPLCPTCGKVKERCRYNGNHPKCQTCGMVKEECLYKGNHPLCNTCKQVKEFCPYEGNHPDPEATGYNVNFSCNVPSAILYVDGKQNGTVVGTLFMETGQHTIRLTSKGYKDFTQDITVSAESKDFSITMTKDEPAQSKTSATPAVPAVIQQLERDMVLVKGGTFTMGATTEQGINVPDWEKPVHQVTLHGFYICKHEVTQAEWETVMVDNPSYFKGSKRPVEQVSWEECQEFIKRLNNATGKNYRLPTEAEWEYAARGGQTSQNTIYSGSNKAGNVSWHETKSTHDVMSKAPNELGLYDMSGNVCEWCSDWYDKEYYKNNYNLLPLTNPSGPSSGAFRVTRGGSWIKTTTDCRVSARDGCSPSRHNNGVGFRLACSVEE